MPSLRACLRNWAETDEPGDPALAAVVLPVPPGEALARVEAAVRTLPRWQLRHSDALAGTIQATRQTRLFRFTDDITVRLEPAEGGTRVRARSQSRVGLLDFGQNRRNLIELLSALRAARPIE
jgi:uncharacterized protein (DUF1499 family)